MRALPFVLVLLACGGAEEPEPAPETTPVATTSGAERPPPPEARDRLDGLHDGDTLTYVVQLPSEDDREVMLVVDQVVRYRAAAAVKLRNVGTPLGESPVYVGWVVSNDEGLHGLEAHVSLSEPGFVPIDESGALVTEARASVAWRVPPEWLDPTSRAFESDPVAGWRLEGVTSSIVGAIRGERCATLQREDGSLRTSLQVCDNLGVVALQQHGGSDAVEQRWRLVDVGQRPAELQPPLTELAPPEHTDATSDPD